MDDMEDAMRELQRGLDGLRRQTFDETTMMVDAAVDMRVQQRLQSILSAEIDRVIEGNNALRDRMYGFISSARVEAAPTPPPLPRNDGYADELSQALAKVPDEGDDIDRIVEWFHNPTVRRMAGG